MSIFDIFETVIEKTVETVLEVPTIPFKIAKGTIKGTRKAMSKISDDLIDEIEDD